MMMYARARLMVFALSVFVVSGVLLSLAANAADGDAQPLAKVAEAILNWDGQSPGTLFTAVKAANPSQDAIVSMRELNKALADGTLPSSVSAKKAEIIKKQGAAQKSVREKVLAVRKRLFASLVSGQGGKSLYGYGDIGSWSTASEPDASMDIDWTVFGVDPDITAQSRDQYCAELIKELGGTESELTLKDFDIVVTAEGHEAQAGVFETEGGIDWAKRNMKRVTIVNPDGSSLTYELGKGDPVGEMAMAENMANLRNQAQKNGDYDKLFDAKGNLKSSIFDDPNNSDAQALWDKYTEWLSKNGVDFYRSKSNTAPGGCLDMAKHLNEEVLGKKFEPKAKLKKTLKYVWRADNISRGVAGVGKLIAADPILGDASYSSVVELARRIQTASPQQIDAILRENFGDMPDAGLQELGNKARRVILRMAELSYQCEIDRIILEVPDKASRKAALDKLAADFKIISEQGGEYTELSKSAIENITKLSEANESGAIEALKKNYKSLEQIQQSDKGLITRTKEFLNETKLGKQMLETGGALLELGQTEIIATAEPKFRSATADFMIEIADSAKAKSIKVVEYAGSVQMWAEVLDSVRTAKSNADLAIALGKTLVNNTFFGMVLNTAYAGVVKGDNEALAKAIMYMIVPETALPALVEALGNQAINTGAQMLFDGQMDKVYEVTKFDKDGKISDFGGLGMAGEEGAKYFVDAMIGGRAEEVAQDFIAKNKATDAGNTANLVAIRAVAKSIVSTVEKGEILIFKEDGPLLSACAGIKKCSEDINDCAKIWGTTVSWQDERDGEWKKSLDRAQTGAMNKLIDQRNAFRDKAKVALAEAMIRTFEDRHRAEKALDSGDAVKQYEELKKLLEDLGITKEGTASLDEEGSPYNIITNWTTSEREKQIQAVKTVQKFLDAYKLVMQARTSAEEAAKSNIGDSFTPDPRPLTGSLPLNAKPEIDVKIARSYIGDVAKIGESTQKDLEILKKSALNSAYDTGVFRKLYTVRFQIAYWSAMMTAASEAQNLHWKIEIFDKQTLYNKHSEAATKVGDYRKQELAIIDDFKKHYELQGDFVVTLDGPDELQSGQNAKLVCSVKIKPKDGAAQPVPDDIASQFIYAWNSGKVSLGSGAAAEKSYKLDSVGAHQFSVVVTRKEMINGKAQIQKIGQASCAVKVVPSLGITIKIEGKSTAVAGDSVTLKAIASAKKPPLPKLSYIWYEGQVKLGGGDTIELKKTDPAEYVITLKAVVNINGKMQPIGEQIHKIKVGKSKVGSVVIEGLSKAKPDEKVDLKAVVTADPAVTMIRCVWKESGTSLGEGIALAYTSREEKAHTITVIVYGKLQGKEEEIARTEHTITVAKEDLKLGQITAGLEGVKSEVVAGGSVEMSAVDFRDTSGKPIPKDTRFKIVWHSEPAGVFTPKETIDSQKTCIVGSADPGKTVSVWGEIFTEASGKFVSVGKTETRQFTMSKNEFTVTLDATKTTLKPGEVVDVIATASAYDLKLPLKYEWTGEYGASTEDKSKVSFASRQNGPHVLSVEVTDAKGRKGTASITLTVMGITAKLVGVPDEVVYGQKAKISVSIDGLDKVQQAAKPASAALKKDEWVLTEIIREDNAVEFQDKEHWEGQIRYKDDWTFSESTDSSYKGEWRHPNVPITVTANWAMPPLKIKPGQEVKIPWSIQFQAKSEGDGSAGIELEADKQPSCWEGQKKINDDQGYVPFRGDIYPPKGTYRFTFPAGKAGDVKKFVVTAWGEYTADGSVPFTNTRRTFVYTYAADKPLDIGQPINIIWQSSPGITFAPSTSQDKKTSAQFDRMGKVKVWAEVQLMKDGAYETIGETDQKEVEVKAPQFVVTFEPAEGQGKVGQEIKATVKTNPAVDSGLIEYVWTSPASSNRKEIELNASSISFKLADANPLQLAATARVPKWLDVIGEVEASYTASPYTVKADVTGTLGPKPQIWKEGVGLVEVEKGTYASDERVSVKATIEGDPAPTDVRWKWTVNEGTSLAGGDVSPEATITRHDTGTAEATVEARDKDGVFLGKATASFTVTVSANDIKNAKDKGGAIEVTLTAPKTSVVAGNSLKLTATVKGGKAPFSYFWTGECKGQGTTATFTSKKIGEQTVTVTVKDSKGTKASKSIKIEVDSPNLAVKLKADRTSLNVNESVNIVADISGGKAPYTVKWTGSIEGSGTTTRFTAPEPGASVVQVLVTDAKKKTASAQVTFAVAELVPVLSGIPSQALLGTQSNGSVTYPQSPAGSKINACPLPTIIWHTDPFVKMSVSRSDAPANTITWTRLGEVKVWVEIVRSNGKILGKTETKVVQVIAPNFEVELAEISGGRVSARVKGPANFDLSGLMFKWMRPSYGSSPTGSPSVWEFTPQKKGPTDVLLIIRTKDTEDRLQEIRCQYTPGQGQKDKTDKTPDNKVDNKSNEGADKALAENKANEQIQQAKTLAANGKFDEAIRLVDDAGKVIPEKAALARKDIAREAAGWSGIAVSDLDFEKAGKLAVLAVKLDPDSDAIKQKQAEVRGYAEAFGKSQKLQDDFDANLKDHKIVSADKTYREVDALIRGIPAASKIQPILKSMSDRLTSEHEFHGKALSPYRVQIMDDIKHASWEHAISPCKQVLSFKVVPELFPAQEKEYRDWLALCESKAKKKPVAVGKKPESSKPATTPKSGKKSGNLLDDIDRTLGNIDKILGGGSTAKQPDAPTEPKKPTTVVDIGNTGGCSLTDKSTFTLTSAVRVTQIIIWSSWANNETSVPYQLFDSSSRVIASRTFTRGQSDTYQKNWCNGVDEPNLTLQAGTYTVKVPKAMIGQNSGTGGNGMIRVVTGGLLVPAGSTVKVTPITKTKPSSKPVVKPTPKQTARPATKSVQTQDVPLKPASVGSKCPAGWVVRTVGDVTLCVPADWATVSGGNDAQGAWYTGDKDEPDAGFGVLRQGNAEELMSQLEIHSQSSITVSGRSAISYMGKDKQGPLVGWMVVVSNAGFGGNPVYFIGVAKPELWSRNRVILEKILGTVRIGKQTAATQKVSPKPPAKPSKVKMITAILSNQCSQNVHLFVEGGKCEPANRLTPGETRKVSIKMPADGRIKFCAGRGGSVIGSAVWNGDPDDTNRIPKVTFDSSERLLVVTSLK